MLITSSTTQAEYEIKKSRFISFAFPCASEQLALDYLHKLKSQYPDARHIAFAWRIRQADGLIAERFSDDGEPTGTAGKPILAPLEGQGVINTVVAVVRYFGGIKLGTGGLVRAYGQAAKLVLAQAQTQTWIEMAMIRLTIDYAQLQQLEYDIKQCNGVITAQTFTDDVQLSIELPATAAKAILKRFS